MLIIDDLVNTGKTASRKISCGRLCDGSRSGELELSSLGFGMKILERIGAEKKTGGAVRGELVNSPLIKKCPLAIICFFA